MEAQDLGEQGLLKLIQNFCPQDIVGDDAAVVTFPPEANLVATTDILIDRVHFSNQTTSPFDVGYRGATANLSDIAAMGANPIGITVALAVPPHTCVTWIEQLYQGLSACLGKYNTPILGGDIARSQVKVMSITALGQVKPQRVIKRKNAQIGDAIVTTGLHGVSRAGLELLLSPEKGKNLSEEQKARLISAHQRPEPRLDVLPILAAILGDNWRVGGMDSSDGLADAVSQICQSSGVGARIYQKDLPVPPGLPLICPQDLVWDWILYGGEDFELILTLPPAQAKILVNVLDKDAKIIGEVTAESKILLIGEDKVEELTLKSGFQHF
ncbi:MAG: thiamine-phosphate kinase [Cyanobacteria bacterium J083]|nr:MAG: thiamine-phosphate kinase [Cyanobacteria bacterium J083]